MSEKYSIYFPKISTAFVGTFFQEQKMKHLEYKD